MTWENACRTLGISETSTSAEIKEQYLYRVQLLHPDKTLDKPEKIRQKAEEEMARINEAYKFLSNDNNNPCTPPKLEVAPLAVRFTEMTLNQKKATTIDIKSVGGPYTNCWIDNSPAPWLTVTGVKTITSEALPLLVTIEAQGIPAVIKPERCSILIRLKNEKTGLVTEVAVGVEIVPLFLTAKLKVNKRKIKFHNAPLDTVSSYAVEIGNDGPDVLHGYIVTDSPWLSVSRSELVLPKKTRNRCTFNIDTDNLAAGFHDTGIVSICTNGGEVLIPVELTTTRRGPERARHSSFGTSPKAYGGMRTATPAPQTRRGSSGDIWLVLFIMLLAIAFIVCLLYIIFFADDMPTWLR
ncbi:MAG: J domain-containing protein [Dehalococcoidia bacterium]|nr:J domain-containing protein [Dehalococcoidia bacterium]